MAMGYKHTEDDWIVSMDEEEFDTFRSFLRSLNLSAENSEVLDHWFSESVWNVESDDGEKFLVVFGKVKIHIIMKKNEQFEELQKKFLTFLPLKKYS